MAVKEDECLIPSMTDVVFALWIDAKQQQEHVLIGERDQVREYMIRGYAKLIFDVKRPFGTFLEECSHPVPKELLQNGLGVSLYRYPAKDAFHREDVAILNAIWQSDNIVHRYTALRLWQEYLNSGGGIKTKKKYETFMSNFMEIYDPVKYMDKEYILRMQNDEKQNPLAMMSEGYLRHPVSLLYGEGRKQKEYAQIDVSVFPLVIYYLKAILRENAYVQTCKRCGKLFRAHTAKIATFCSPECKREQGKVNKQRYQEKTKGLEYETAYQNAYAFWHYRIEKIKKGSNDETVRGAKAAFAVFRDEACQRKKKVGVGEMDTTAFDGWLIEQERIIEKIVEEVHTRMYSVPCKW